MALPVVSTNQVDTADLSGVPNGTIFSQVLDSYRSKKIWEVARADAGHVSIIL